MPRRSLNHESEQEPCKWVYTSIHLLLWAMKGTTEVREKPLLARDKNTLHAKQRPPKLTRSCGCCKVFFPKPICTVDATYETPAGRHAQSQYLPSSCYVGVSCSIVVHSHEQVIVAHVVKECCRVVVGLNGFVDLFTVWCQSHHILNRLCSAWTCWCTWCIDPSPRLTTWENHCESGFFSACSHSRSSQTRTCCSHIQQSFNCICTFCGKEHEVSYGACRLSGKVGYDWTWRSNHEWSIPVRYLCFHRYRMVH